MTEAITIIIVALIGGFITLWQIKANLVTSARIKWIESMRQLVGEQCALMIQISKNIKTAFPDPSTKTSLSESQLTRYQDDAKKYNIIHRKILIHLNHDKPNHKELEDILRQITNLYIEKDYNEKTVSELNKKLDSFMKVSRIIINSEWDKTKKLFKYW